LAISRSKNTLTAAVIEEAHAALIAVLFLQRLGAAELQDRGAARRCGIHAAADVVLGVHGEVALDLVRQPTLAPPGAEQPAHALHPAAQPPHAPSSRGARNRSRIAVVCSQFAVARASCLRPPRVSR
jgi:hypothetical protein